MNQKQLSEHIGNIDDRLVEQAEQIPNYGKKHRQKRIKRLIAAVAVFVLMAGSFSAGAFAFAREIMVEVPVEQETVSLEEIGLTLILPDSWKGKYSVVKNGQNYIFYHTEIREAVSRLDAYEGGAPFTKGQRLQIKKMGLDAYDGGALFTIVCYEEAMTPEQFVENGYDFVPYHYLFSTSDRTYVLCYVSDVQWNPDDSEQEEEYLQMTEEMKDIKFVVDGVLAD